MSQSVTAFNSLLLEWLDIPAGKTTLEGEDKPIIVRPFKIARFPVTNSQFDAFIQDGGYKNDRWWRSLAQAAGAPRTSNWHEADCPKLQVCWFEAVAFCRWLANRTGLNIRLPTEWEWQWAAAGDSGWDYPYGSAFDSSKCNTKENGFRRTNAVTDYSDIETHFGVVDMSGNVWEWCLNEGAVPQNVQIEGDENRALRGGSWNTAEKNACVTFRSHRTPRTRTHNIGFRVIAL